MLGDLRSVIHCPFLSCEAQRMVVVTLILLMTTASPCSGYQEPRKSDSRFPLGAPLLRSFLGITVCQDGLGLAVVANSLSSQGYTSHKGVCLPLAVQPLWVRRELCSSQSLRTPGSPKLYLPTCFRGHQGRGKKK